MISGSGASAKVVAVVGFQSSSTSLSGGAQGEGSYVAGDGTKGLEFGTVTLDLTKGQAVVQKSSVTAKAAPAACSSPATSPT